MILCGFLRVASYELSGCQLFSYVFQWFMTYSMKLLIRFGDPIPT